MQVCLHRQGDRSGDGYSPPAGLYRFQERPTLASLKKLDARAHWEVCRGTPEQNRTYCSKGGDFEERGVKPVSKEENGEVEKARWRTIIDLAESGDWDALRSEHPDVYATRLLAAAPDQQEACSRPLLFRVIWDMSGYMARLVAENPALPGIRTPTPISRTLTLFGGTGTMVRM